MADPEPTVLDFTCPRCARDVAEEFYGPCADCRATLRSSLGGEAREIEVAAFEPTMHVTPDAVALKE